VWVAALGPGIASAAETLEQALRESDVIVDVRLRYESVEQVEFAQTADAVTIRLRVGFESAPYGKTALLAEAVWVEDLVDHYNSTTNGQTEYPVVADPTDFVAINRFALINKSLPNTTLTLGRQRIILDDQRFVGNGGWRQNEQTFDGLRALLDARVLKADLTYAAQVNRIFGPGSPQGKWEGDIVLANLSRSLPVGTLTVFDSYVDVDNTTARPSNTLGARLAGTKPIGKVTGSYALSYARQSDIGESLSNHDETYYFLEGGLTFKKLAVLLGLERLGGDGASAFSTPVGTLHAFQGWADKFLATPPAGIKDQYVKLTYPIAKRGRFTSTNAVAVFHDFLADAGSTHFGEELDLQLVARTEHLALTLKYAEYRADALHTDTDKLWLSVDYLLGT
jgi:hypothetical protein